MYPSCTIKLFSSLRSLCPLVVRIVGPNMWGHPIHNISQIEPVDYVTLPTPSAITSQPLFSMPSVHDYTFVGCVRYGVSIIGVYQLILLDVLFCHFAEYFAHSGWCSVSQHSPHHTCLSRFNLRTSILTPLWYLLQCFLHIFTHFLSISNGKLLNSALPSPSQTTC